VLFIFAMLYSMCNVLLFWINYIIKENFKNIVLHTKLNVRWIKMISQYSLTLSAMVRWSKCFTRKKTKPQNLPQTPWYCLWVPKWASPPCIVYVDPDLSAFSPAPIHPSPPGISSVPGIGSSPGSFVARCPREVVTSLGIVWVTCWDWTSLLYCPGFSCLSEK